MGTTLSKRRLATILGLLLLSFAMGAGVLAVTQGPGPMVAEPEPPRLARVLSRTIEAKGIEAAAAEYRSLRERGFPGLRESESDTNRLGYELLGKGRLAGAIRVFELNAETHPRSANVYDSLAEAQLEAGHRDLAIENYRKALALSPGKKSAASALRRLTPTGGLPYPPLLLFHITAGLVAIVAGGAAMGLRKGSRRHGAAGNVFFASMLGMSSTGAYMAFTDPHGEAINVLMGLLAFYLVSTAWLAARRRSAGTSAIDWAALLLASALAAGLAGYGVEASRTAGGAKDGVPAAVYLVFSGVAALASAGDLRMIARGGVSGAQRIARHLWRMCCALFIAVSSFFLGQPQAFPRPLRDSGLLAVPSLLVVIALIFWLVRVSFTGAFKRAAARPPAMPVAAPMEGL